MSAPWPPSTAASSGIPEVEPAWVEENLASIELLDVREPAEFGGPLGHISGARLIPLGQLAQRLSELPEDKPLVAVCRSGARSAQAVHMLQSAGFEQVANLTGGMQRWREEGRSGIGTA